MNFNEFVERDEKALEKASKCRNIDEFRKLVVHWVYYTRLEFWSLLRQKNKKRLGVATRRLQVAPSSIPQGSALLPDGCRSPCF